MSTKEGENQAGWNRFRVPFAWEMKVETVTVTLQSEGVENAGSVLPAAPILGPGEQARLLESSTVIPPTSGPKVRRERRLPAGKRPELGAVKPKRKKTVRDMERHVERLERTTKGHRDATRKLKDNTRESTKIAKKAEKGSLSGAKKAEGFAANSKKWSNESRTGARRSEDAATRVEALANQIKTDAEVEAIRQKLLKKKENKEAWLRKEQEAKKTKLQIEKSIKKHEVKKTKREMWLTKQPAKEARRLELEKNRKANEVKRLEWLKKQEAKKVKGVNKMKERNNRGRVIVIRENVTNFVKKEKKKIAGTVLAAAIIGGAIGGAYFYPKPEGNNVAVVATPTPSAATGTPRPTEIPTTTPIPTEVVKTPNFGVRYDSNTEKCVPVDKATGKAVDTSNTLSIERISYQETGVGVTKIISTILKPGQTAITQGWKVDGQGNGVFKAIIAHREMTINSTISDGAVEVVDSQNGPLVFCRAVQIAVDKGYAHEKVEIPEAWKVTQ